MRNIIRHFYQLRETYPVLNDGYFLQQLSNQTDYVVYPGSSGVVTETGLWSTVRMGFPGIQNFAGVGQGDVPMWLVYSNLNISKTYEFDCQSNLTDFNTTSLIAPFEGGTTVKNLLPPFDELVLVNSNTSLGLNGSTAPNGCLDSLDIAAYGFKLYVPQEDWVGPRPMITKFSPGHDARIVSKVAPDKGEDVDIELHFSTPMDCESVTNSINLGSSKTSKNNPVLNPHSVTCGSVKDPKCPRLTGELCSQWSWSATLENVEHGVHKITVRNASALDGTSSTNSVDHFLIRIGHPNNPMVFPRTGNYSSTLLVKDDSGELFVNHSAPGADLWRFSTNWGTTYSEWLPYTGGQVPVELQPWSGTARQNWKGDHIRVEYWSQLSGSSDHVQEGDADYNDKARRFPHLFVNGPYNEYGYDAGLENTMSIDEQGLWDFHFLTEWPAVAQVNVWGLNPDAQPDQGWVYGDADGDSILDRLPPSSLSAVILNVTIPPPSPAVAWRLKINDGTGKFLLVPDGSMWWQLILFVLLAVVPLVTAVASVWVFMHSFYGVKFNEVGVQERDNLLSLALKRYSKLKQYEGYIDEESRPSTPALPGSPMGWKKFRQSRFFHAGSAVNTLKIDSLGTRRTVLIATMEYDIEDWEIKIKIGGLGVMAQLMGKHLGFQDLIWIVPCVGGVDYPTDQKTAPFTVKILGNSYKVGVQTHKLRNITYVLLDAPTFRQQTKAEPYPARMDDLNSAIYYSAWNQCIAQAIERYSPDLYHINDYHGCLAPLYLQPTTVPVCLSLHNAEFQGLWPMRTRQECEEISGIFNLSHEFVQRFVQFGEVFNLLHAGASYLRVYQDGFGAVGVSKKYGKRSYLRYPIFWGLTKIGQLPNPDPSDTGEWDKKLPREEDITIDLAFESARPELRRQAQQWAGLDQNPDAELFVFVGRWSMQKGIDLIADLFPAVLEAHPNVQLICIGPVIDLYGKFAALKLEKMMKLYPGRVFSKPVFTALPPYIFSGAEFALIPSRDEPFGLVAVEFGRKGALGVGARVGGLGQMPGWWYTVESMQTAHLLHQFKLAIEESLSSRLETRQMMRARSAKQRFPVAQWTEDLAILQSTAIRMHKRKISKRPKSTIMSGSRSVSSATLSRPDSLVRFSAPPGLPLSSFGDHGHFARSDSTPNSTPGSRSHSRQPSRPVSLRSNTAPAVPPICARRFQNRSSTSLHPSSPEDSDDEERHFQARGTEMDLDESEDITVHSAIPQLQLPRLEFSPANSDHISGVSTPAGEDSEEEESHPAPILSQARACEVVRVHRKSQVFDYTPTASLLSFNGVVGESKDFNLQKVDPFFTDQTGEYYEAYSKKLDGLTGSNSEALCIEEFLTRSEKKFFGAYRRAKLGVTPASTVASTVASLRSPSVTMLSSDETVHEDLGSDSGGSDTVKDSGTFVSNSMKDPWQLGDDYVAPTGLRNWLSIRVGDWPIYAYILAFGQVIAANSYQITLLTGTVGESAEKLYVICSIYLAASILWWTVFRTKGSLLCLSLPFFFYGTAFFFIGVARYGSTTSSRGWLQNVGTGSYAIASASGSMFFALNFGDEGGATVRTWVFRACVIQGSQQIYNIVLWFWGAYLNRQRVMLAANATLLQDGSTPFSQSWKTTAIMLPAACALWGLGIVLYVGLPTYYRQTPGIVPGFYRSLTRRRIILWFFFTVCVQNFFLSSQYGK